MVVEAAAVTALAVAWIDPVVFDPLNLPGTENGVCGLYGLCSLSNWARFAKSTPLLVVKEEQQFCRTFLGLLSGCGFVL